MSSQDSIEHDLRMLIGDLQVQLIVVRAQLIEAREAMSKSKLKPEPELPGLNLEINDPDKPNGKAYSMKQIIE